MSTKRISPINGPIDSVVQVPGSKSIANRALVLAALSEGRTELSNVPDGDDTEALLAGIGDLGCGIERQGDSVRIAGPIDLAGADPLTINAQLAGTTSRFLTAVAALRIGETTIDGNAALRKRPNKDLRDALADLGAKVSSPTVDGLPVTVSAGVGNKREIQIKGDVSSQFISALMLIGCRLPNGLILRLSEEVVSRSYVRMTASVLKSFGVDVALKDSRITIGAGLPSCMRFQIEPDASSASYPLAAAAIIGGRMVVPGLGRDSLQSDSIFASLLQSMGVKISVDTDTTIERDAATSLHGIEVNLADSSDLVPTLATVCCFADSPSVISGVGFIRKKESNRIEGLAEQLNRLGGDVEPLPDGLRIRPAELHGGVVSTMDDHRIAMALSLAGLAMPGVEIEDPSVVNKSWPGFWEMLDQIH